MKFNQLRRREFISLLGGAAAWPFAARAQQTMPVVGFLSTLGRDERPNLREAFRRGLSELGYVDGRNISIEYRFAENRHDQLPMLAADLIERKVAVIAATGGGSAIVAAKSATARVPIVFVIGGDPVEQGYVSSLARPGGNVTGVSFFNNLLSAKGLGLLHELVPNAAAMALLANPKAPDFARVLADTREAAQELRRQLYVLTAADPSEIEAAFAELRQRRGVPLLVAGDAFYTARRQQIVALAARDSIPAMYFNREFVVEGGLISYGNDIPNVYRRAGIYAARIIKGEQPSDLPVDRATKFEFAINLKTAKALGIDVPAALLIRADEVIE